MDDRRDLDDLLIDDEEAIRSTQSKKMMLVIAAAVVLFAMVVFSIYALTREEEQTQILPSAPVEKMEKIEEKQPGIAGNNANEQRFQQVPLQKEELSSDEKFERIVREIKARQSANATLPTPPIEEKSTQTPPPLSEPKSTSKPIWKPTTPTTNQANKDKKQPPKETTKRTSVTESFKNVATTPKKSEKSEKNTKSIPKGYYVQVGSFAKFSPTGSFAKKIEGNQFTYQTQQETLSGKEMIRVLIGPYASRAEANNALEMIKEKIEPKSFIKQVQ